LYKILSKYYDNSLYIFYYYIVWCSDIIIQYMQFVGVRKQLTIKCGEGPQWYYI